MTCVNLFVFDTMSDWEYCYLVAGTNNPQFQKTPGRFKVKTVALLDQPVTTVGGLRVLPDLTLAKLKPTSSGMLILPGGEAWDKKKKQSDCVTGSRLFNQRNSGSRDLRCNRRVGAHRFA